MINLVDRILEFNNPAQKFILNLLLMPKKTINSYGDIFHLRLVLVIISMLIILRYSYNVIETRQ